jgi:uncharacterized protein
VIAVDTNLLVYAHRPESEFHADALTMMRRLTEGTQRWGIPIPCFWEFYAVVTNARIYARPSTTDIAFRQISAWRGSPSFAALSTTANHLHTLEALCVVGKVTGGMVHDARIASICIENGVSELWTADRDFSRLRGIKAINPLVNDMPK